MRRTLRRLNAVWAPEAPASRLALVRIVVGVYALQHLAQRTKVLERVARADPCLFEPIGVVTLRSPLAPEQFRALLAVTLAANVAFVLGWRYRLSGPGFAATLLWLLTYRNSWSMLYHSENVMTLHVIVLGLSPAADVLSLDRPRPRSGSKGRRTLTRLTASARRGTNTHWRYGWPLQLMNTISVLTYFLAGVAKLKGPLGIRWASGESLRSQVAIDGLRKELLGDGAAPLTYRVLDRVAMFRALAAGSLLIEVGAPLALLDRRLARGWAINAFLMHWGIYLVMRIKFRYQLAGVQFAPFFELERALPRVAQ